MFTYTHELATRIVCYNVIYLDYKWTVFSVSYTPMNHPISMHIASYLHAQESYTQREYPDTIVIMRRLYMHACIDNINY